MCDELARKVREKGKVSGVSVLSSLPKYSGLRPRRSCTFAYPMMIWMLPCLLLICVVQGQVEDGNYQVSASIVM